MCFYIQDENTKSKIQYSDTKTQLVTVKGELSRAQSENATLRSQADSWSAEKKEVYATLQDSILDRQRLVELVRDGSIYIINYFVLL